LAAKKKTRVRTLLSFDWLAPAPFRGKCSSLGNQELCTRKLLQVMNVSVLDACAFVSSISQSVRKPYVRSSMLSI